MPASCFAEETGSFTNSSRVIQWHWAAAEPPGEAKIDREIIGTSVHASCARCTQGRRQAARSDAERSPGPTPTRTIPTPEEVLREINGRALVDVVDPKDKTKTFWCKAGEQIAGFGVLQDDGSTSCGNWMYCGFWSQAGNLTARRDTTDPGGLGNYPNWGYSWPANRRILYNRAGADPRPASRGIRSAGGIRWNGTRWAGIDVPDMRPDARARQGAGPFIMTRKAWRACSRSALAEGPFPEHYEPFETPIGTNPHAPEGGVSNPAARVYKGDMEAFGKAERVSRTRRPPTA